jgi:hypothetical protein
MCIFILNFIAFFIGWAYLGGDAVNGKEQNGHYYVSDKGRLTEVTHGEYVYSRIHVASLFVGFAIYILAWPCLYLTGDYRPTPRGR